MDQNKPANPAQAATPGNGQQGSGTPSPVTPAPPTPTGQGAQAEGQVTISTKEYAELQRAKARSLSFDRRAEFNRKNPPRQVPANGEGSGDPEVLARLQQEQDARVESERRAYRAEVTLKVHDLLGKEEFKNLPASTRALILKNPAMLSEADNVDEALLDIEDFVRDQVAGLVAPPVQNNQQPGQGSGTRPSASPAGHDTPPVVGGGSPAPVTGVELEDTSKLTGPARSRAILRNSLKKAKRGN